MLASSSRVCLPWFSFTSFPWWGGGHPQDSNLKTLLAVFSAFPSPMPRVVMPKKSKHSQFNPHTGLFPQFFPIPVLQEVFLLTLTTPDGCCDGVGDTWGHSLLPRLTGSHSLVPVHELLQRGLLSVGLMYPSEIRIQLALLDSSFASSSLHSNLKGAQAGIASCASSSQGKMSMPFPK